jgi:hypothetical protein
MCVDGQKLKALLFIVCLKMLVLLIVKAYSFSYFIHILIVISLKLEKKLNHTVNPMGFFQDTVYFYCFSLCKVTKY